MKNQRYNKVSVFTHFGRRTIYYSNDFNRKGLITFLIVVKCYKWKIIILNVAQAWRIWKQNHNFLFGKNLWWINFSSQKCSRWLNFSSLACHKYYSADYLFKEYTELGLSIEWCQKKPTQQKKNNVRAVIWENNCNSSYYCF